MSFPKRRDTSVLNLESPDAIIYDFCDGDKEIPHREIITAERLPNAESFSDLKAESDSIYSAIHSGDRSYDDHTVSPFDDVDFGVSPSCEDVLIEAMDQRNKALFMERLVIYLLSGLSPKIRRRFVLRNEKNLLEKEIAEMEGVTPQAISKSLKKADAIVCLFFRMPEKTGKGGFGFSGIHRSNGWPGSAACRCTGHKSAESF